MSRFPQLDILPAAQRTLWPQLADVRRHSFVLYGGTAVALYLGHRNRVPALAMERSFLFMNPMAGCGMGTLTVSQRASPARGGQHR